MDELQPYTRRFKTIQRMKSVLVSILFTRSDSIYKTLGVDCWDIDRDATKWPGGNSIVAHPPCRCWGTLKHFAKPRPGEKELAIWAVRQIRKWGGVLEHPRSSSLWKHMNLPTGTQRDEFGGFSISVNQHWFGHRAEKKTLLYIVGMDPGDLPDYSFSNELPTGVIYSGFKRPNKNAPKSVWKKVCHKNGRVEISKKEREATPVEFAKWLIEVAKRCGTSRP